MGNANGGTKDVYSTYDSVSWTDGVFDHAYDGEEQLAKNTDGKKYSDAIAAKKACAEVLIGNLDLNSPSPSHGGRGVAYDGKSWYCVVGDPPRRCKEGSAPCGTPALKFSRRCAVPIPNYRRYASYHNSETCGSRAINLVELETNPRMVFNTEVDGARILIFNKDQYNVKLRSAGQEGEPLPPEHPAVCVNTQRVADRWKMFSALLSVLLVVALIMYFKGDEKGVDSTATGSV